MRILSIDVWGNKEDGFEWNQWWHVGDVDELPDSNAGIIQYMIDKGFLKYGVNNQVYVSDDQFNMVVHDMETDEPLYAIEYGE